MTYDNVISSPYGSHRNTQPYMTISIFFGLITDGSMVHRHMSKCVDFPTIGDHRLHFTRYVIVDITPTTSPFACVDGYL